MADLACLVLIAVLSGLSWGLVALCDRLGPRLPARVLARADGARRPARHPPRAGVRRRDRSRDTFAARVRVPLLQATVDAERGPVTEQVLAVGPVASQVAIKQLGTNGGGFYNVNSAHPFENPTALSNFLQTLAILLIPAACCFAFGTMVRDRRQGVALYATMLAVFIAGLMVGRTPEYLGKKIEAHEMKMASLVILLPPASVLVGTAIACLVPEGRASLANPGAHGFSEILYALSSGPNNNGSALAGLTASGPFFATAIGIAMWIGRYWLLVPILAIAGSLAAKRHVPASVGTLPTHGPLFVTLLAGTVLLVGALAFLPVLALGPIVEHLLLLAR